VRAIDPRERAIGWQRKHDSSRATRVGTWYQHHENRARELLRTPACADFTGRHNIITRKININRRGGLFINDHRIDKKVK